MAVFVRTVCTRTPRDEDEAPRPNGVSLSGKGMYLYAPLNLKAALCGALAIDLMGALD